MYYLILKPSMVALIWPTLSAEAPGGLNYAAGAANGSGMVGMYMCYVLLAKSKLSGSFLFLTEQT